MELARKLEPSEAEAAKIVRKHKEEIIRLWLDRIRSELPAANSMPRPILRNEVPRWLESLADALEQSDAKQTMAEINYFSKEHGRLRTRYNFDLPELLTEYFILREVVMEVLEQHSSLTVRQQEVIFTAVQYSMKAAAEEHQKISYGKKRREILYLGGKGFFFRCLVSIGLVLLATGLQWLLWSAIDPLAYLLYFPAIILSSLYGQGLLAIILSMVIAQFLFIPAQDFYFGYREVVRLATFLFSSLLVSKITQSLKESKKIMEAVVHDQAKARSNAELAEDRAEENLKEARIQRELREQFVLTLTHDLRGPITAAKMSADMIFRYKNKAEIQKKHLIKIFTNLERADHMIQDLLDANRIEAGQKISLHIVETDLRSLLEDILEHLFVSYNRKILLQGPKQLLCYCSPEDIRRVVENLCSNAIKYGDPNGEIKVVLLSSDDTVSISVHNYGSVIPLEEQKHLFQIFHRSPSAHSDQRRGWGLGLVLVRGIVEAHNGHVKVESSAEHGTIFTVEFPFDARAAG